jgi:LytS/YehU family sensor histidine kinase
MVIALGELLRLTLEDTGQLVRSLAEELEFADLYLGIEKLRLGDRLVINYDIEPEATRAEVPQLLLQPLFENAVRHGAARITGVCEIRFRAYQEREWLRLMISNDGPAHPRALGLRGPEWVSPTPKTGSACTTRIRSCFNTPSVQQAGFRSISRFRIRAPGKRLRKSRPLYASKPSAILKRNCRPQKYRLSSVFFMS